MEHFQSIEKTIVCAKRYKITFEILYGKRSHRYNVLCIHGTVVFLKYIIELDQDFVAIYGYEVKRLNEQVKRNISRFPEDFMFQIEPEEVPDRLKSQIATLNGSNNKRGMHIKMMPYAFTEQGIHKADLTSDRSVTTIWLPTGHFSLPRDIENNMEKVWRGKGKELK